MILESLRYSQHSEDSRHWSFDELKLGQVNLIVGMNASGKTRTLNVINSLAGLMTGLKPVFASGNYDATFVEGVKSPRRVSFRVKMSDSRVVEERLRMGGQVLLKRTASGKGRIKATKLRKDINFQVPTNKLASVAKRDALQHPFLEKLHDWGASVQHFQCRTTMGKDLLIAVGKGATVKGKFSQDPGHAAATFLSGCQRFGRRAFKTPIIRDMKKVGYSLRNITVEPPNSVTLTSFVEAVGLHTHERDLKCSTDQNSMSMGMFRALALLIQVNYCLLANPKSCVLIDDIGEGLDYERCVALVDVVRQKVLDSSMQLVLSTNSRFVMNHVPFKEWHVLERDGQHVRFHNYSNSRKAFEEYEFTGLSNFDFFRSKIFSEGAPLA